EALARDPHDVEPLERRQPDTDGERPEIVRTTALALHDQPGLDVADEVPVRLRRGHPGGAGEDAERRRPVGVGQCSQERCSHLDGLHTRTTPRVYGNAGHAGTFPTGPHDTAVRPTWAGGPR